MGKLRHIKHKKVRAPNMRKGYERFLIRNEHGKLQQFLGHRLVAMTFIGPIPDRMEVDHINRVRNDNRLSNLRIITRSENSRNVNRTEAHIRYINLVISLHKEGKSSEQIHDIIKKRRY